MKPKLTDLLQRNGGIVQTHEAAAIGVSRASLSAYAAQGKLERLCYGIYASPDALTDEAYIISLRYPGAVFSHASALYLNGLGERLPVKESLTFISRKLPTKAVRKQYHCFSIAAPLHALGLTQRQTAYGHSVPCYNAERTICDLLRSRSRCDEETVVSALKNYAAQGRPDTALLYDYAVRLSVLRALTPYMEILL